MDLSLIILNYNTKDWLKNCLTSIFQYIDETMKIEIIVVDNASTDGSSKMVLQEFPQVKLIQSQENGGFAKGNNLGIKVAKGTYIMLLNSDTEFTEKTDLVAMIQYMNTHKRAGVMTPRLELSDGSLDLASHRGEPTPWAAFSFFSKLERMFPNSKKFAQYHQTWKDFTLVHEIDACSGAAMLVRASLLSKIGLLDEQFFMYAEDLDWCKRFRKAGYKVVYFPHSIIIHHKYKSGLQKEKAFPTQDFLDIPGFDIPHKKTKNKAQHHFFQTMKQYYDKHHKQSYPNWFRWIMHKSVDMIQFIRS